MNNLLTGEFTNIQKNLEVHITIKDNTKIDLSSQLVNITMIKNIINSIRTYQIENCYGNLILNSNIDISKILKDQGLITQ